MDPITLGAIFSIGGKILDKFFPDPTQKAAAMLELEKMKQTGELAQLAADTDLAKGQLEINKIEAQSESLFKSGWRPAVGWIGGFGLLYATVIEPIARFVAAVGFHYTGAFPVIDTMLTLQLLLGLLGLGGMRSFDKKQELKAA